MASVELKGVTKRFSQTVLAVDHIDLTIHDREFLVLVGPSGCGKSTTLRLIAGLEHGDDGEIWIGDREVTRVAPKDRDIAMVFQNYALYPHMSVYRNLSFGLQLRLGGGLLSRVVSRLFQPRKAAEQSAKRREIHDRVTRTAERLGIDSLLKRKPHQLSGGERQRVALGRAIVREPAAFLFDEPLSNLDAKLRGQLRTEIKRLHQQLDTTMIYVTHDQIEAMTLGDRIAVMNQGRIQQLGSPMEVYHQPENLFVARFIGSLPMNLIDGKLIKQDARYLFVAESFELELEESKAAELMASQGIANDYSLTLGIRPENIQLKPGESDPSDRVQESGQLLRAVVHSVDRLGDSTVAYLEPKTVRLAGRKLEEDKKETSKQEILVRTDAFSSIQAGQTVEMEWNMESTHWFDSKSGKNLKTK